MSKAWIAISLAPAVLLFGCQSDQEPVAAVPPPTTYGSTNSGSTLPPPVKLSDPGPISSTGDPVGPAVDPGPAPKPVPLPPPPPAQRTYTIQKNDTFWKIAKREYGNGQKWVDIAQANPSLDPKKLVVGTQIVLP